MEYINPFINTEYTADRNILKFCRQQFSYFLAKYYKIQEVKIRPYVDRVFIPNMYGFKERAVKLLEKNKYGDRELKIKGISDFLNTVQEKNFHLSPSFVAYTHSDEHTSVNSVATSKYIDNRSKYKKLRGVASLANDDYGYKTYNEIQNALKIFNNAQSGAMSSNGTPIRNKSGHTTLTSICRTVTSTVNLMNERLLNGNRLFINYNKTIQHMVSVLKTTDFIRLKEVCDKLNWIHPTRSQVMGMVAHSTKYYWGEKTLSKIEEFVNLLNPLECTAVMCIGDFTSMFATNRKIVKEFLDDWVAVPPAPTTGDEKDYLAPSNGDYYNLCITKIGNKASKLEINALNQYHLNVEQKWFDFIQVFLKTKTAISDVYSVTEMIRESVVTSDTDSSIYSASTVTDLYSDDPEDMISLNGVLTYFIRMMAIHQHMQLSTNINVSKKNLDKLNMKNEFLFGSYVTTLMSKHYYATQLMQEGVKNEKVKMEIKGVHLKSSKVAAIIKEFSHKLMRDILDAIFNKVKIDPSIVLHNVAELERLVIDGIRDKNEWAWLQKATVKAKNVYTNPESSIYQYHELWMNVFADKYGEPPAIPYTAIKFSTTMTSKAKLTDYFELLGDCEVRQRLEKYLAEKDALTTFYIPADCLIGDNKIIPPEIVKGTDFRKIVQQNLKSVYAVLESTGIYVINNKISRLVSDEH